MSSAPPLPPTKRAFLLEAYDAFLADMAARFPSLSLFETQLSVEELLTLWPYVFGCARDQLGQAVLSCIEMQELVLEDAVREPFIERCVQFVEEIHDLLRVL